MKRIVALSLVAALAACGTSEEASDANQAPPEELALGDDTETLGIEDIEEVGPLTGSVEGATPMNERVAVLGVLNKRNGTSREVRLRPGESIRVGDLLIRLRACERTAPWEPQTLTGAFVQLLVRQRDLRGGDDDSWRRVFSGWLFKERPALNVVEHRLYDVWPKACEMTYPGSAPSSPTTSANSSSSAPSAPPPPDTQPAPAPEPAPEPEGNSEDSSNEA